MTVLGSSQPGVVSSPVVVSTPLQAAAGVPVTLAQPIAAGANFTYPGGTIAEAAGALYVAVRSTTTVPPGADWAALGSSAAYLTGQLYMTAAGVLYRALAPTVTTPPGAAWEAVNQYSTGELYLTAAGALYRALTATVTTPPGAAWEAVNTGWTEATLENSFVAHEPLVYLKPAYRRQGNMVRLRGNLKAGVSGSAAFTLPAGYRPLANVQAAGSIYSGGVAACMVIVTSGGAVQLWGTEEHVGIDAVTFTID